MRAVDLRRHRRRRAAAMRRRRRRRRRMSRRPAASRAAALIAAGSFASAANLLPAVSFRGSRSSCAARPRGRALFTSGLGATTCADARGASVCPRCPPCPDGRAFAAKMSRPAAVVGIIVRATPACARPDTLRTTDPPFSKIAARIASGSRESASALEGGIARATVPSATAAESRSRASEPPSCSTGPSSTRACRTLV